MKNDESVLDILRDLIAEDVVKYAIAKEWRKDLDSERHKKFIVLSHNRHKDEQLPVPRDENANDYAKRMKEVIGVLAETEARTKEAVIKDILAFRADVLQYRVISRATQKGSIPISEAITLLEGAKNALLSSACSVLSPSRKHTRLANSANEKKLISACELCHWALQKGPLMGAYLGQNP